MAGGDLVEGSGDRDAAPSLSRRDFARLGVLAGGVAWGAPKVTSVRFATRMMGSGPTTTPSTTEPPPPTTNPPPTTTTTTNPTTTTTGSPPTTQGGGTTTTTGSPPSTQGGTTTTVEGGTTTSVPGGTTSTTSGVGPQTTITNNTTPTTVTTPSTVPTTRPGDDSPYNGGKGSGGVLSFTGADSADLAVLGATAIVVGRALYVFGRRPAEEELEADGGTPPAAP